MAKDPAVLFYTQDFLIGTSFLTPLQKGYYITMLCYQQQSESGSLSLEKIKSLMGKDFKKNWHVIQQKFKEDLNGYYNERMRTEIEKRKQYSDSRRNNRKYSENSYSRVYLIKDLDTGYFKIGSSVDPIRRLHELKNHSRGVHVNEKRNYILFFYTKVDVLIAEEFNLQKTFKSKHIKGEWYDLNIEDIEYIRNYFNHMIIDMDNHMISHMENENENENREEKGGVGEKEGDPLGSEFVAQVANIAWKDQRWRESVCQGQQLTADELKRWMAQYNASICNDSIHGFDERKYKKMFGGWLNLQRSKGYKLPEVDQRNKSGTANLKGL